MTTRDSLSPAQRQEFFAAAQEFVQHSRAAINAYWERGFSSEVKSDTSLVTEADIAAERVLRELIEKRYPHHGIIGEEMPNTNPESEFQWSIDPIDGTQNFAHGVPTFGTVLALHLNNEPVAGVIDHPALNLCYAAGYGLGSFCNGRRLAIVDAKSSVLDVNEIIILSTRGMFKRSGEEHLFDAFVKVHDALRVYFDVFGHTRAAHGNVGAMVEFNVKIWDIGATRLLVEEAGGRYVEVRRWESADSPTRYSALFGKPKVVEALLPYFAASN